MIGSSSRCPDIHALYSGSEAVFAKNDPVPSKHLRPVKDEMEEG